MYDPHHDRTAITKRGAREGTTMRSTIFETSRGRASQPTSDSVVKLLFHDFYRLFSSSYQHRCTATHW